MLKIAVNARVGFTPEEILKHETACRMLETALNSIEFKDGVLSMDLDNMEGKSNLELYRLIMSGADNFNHEADEDIDVSVELYYKNNKVVGYTNPSTIWTWFNRKFFNQYDYADVACNLFHEYLHKCGFDHDSASDHDSVPYALGYFVEKLIRKLMAGEKLTMLTDIPPIIIPDVLPPKKPVKVLVCYRSWRTLWRKKCYYEST